MNELLLKTAQAMMAPGKGLIAMDESNPTCHKRFAKLGIPQTEEMRRSYRELILTTPNLGNWISGAILYDETIHQSSAGGVPFVDLLNKAGIIPGIKVDEGAKDLPGFPGEKVTEGLDGLGERLQNYFKLGARFAKWRAVIAIGDGLPTDGCLHVNAHALARYAALCQAAGIVPIVEPEVLMDGSHSLQQCFEATQRALHALFDELVQQRVLLEGLILKPNMVLSGLDSPTQAGLDEVAEATVTSLLRTVPAAVPGVAFLSGGQPSDLASARLNAMHVRYDGKLPWALTYSFSRALHQDAMDAWKGNPANVPAAQAALAKRAKCCAAAREGKYRPEMEKE